MLACLEMTLAKWHDGTSTSESCTIPGIGSRKKISG
jgi:hypothetical protein